jgi:hypothetical protein
MIGATMFWLLIGVGLAWAVIEWALEAREERRDKYRSVNRS